MSIDNYWSLSYFMFSFMNTITKTSIHIFALIVVLAVLTLFVAVPKVHAADMSLDSGGTGYYFDSYTDSYPASYSDTSSTGYYFDSYTDSYPASYDSGFSGFSGSGFSPASGFTGGWGFGGSGGGFGGSSSANSSVYAPTNTNTCTAFNSCNTTYDDHSIFNAPTNIVTNYPPAQNVVYSQPSYPVYTQPAPVYTPPVYVPAQRPIAYNNAPYVTLAAVPYTGLELGFWGTIAYWGFLVLWCLIAAYLIVVKKIQNKIAAWFTGNATQNSASQKSSDLPFSGALRATPAGQTFVKHNSAPLFTGIDSFVLSQINRA